MDRMINSETYDAAMTSETADLANQQNGSLVDLRSQNNNNNITTSTDNQQPTSLGTFGSVGLNNSSAGFSAPSTGSLFGSTQKSFGFGGFNGFNRMVQSSVTQPLFNVTLNGNF